MYQKASIPYGLVLCGGMSERMGTEKGLLVYHDRPQQYHVYKMLDPICERVYICCNKNQSENILPGYEIMEDKSEYENIGPMAALLTAYSLYPEKDFLVIGCDYPFLGMETLELFMKAIPKKQVASAFYNSEQRYEPLLAWYSSQCASLLQGCFRRGEYALQQFLRSQHAEKYTPNNPATMTSIDTFEQFQQARLLIEKLKSECR
ncbi:molybdenum cofactor guanylyltransferase [Dyadobacter sp. 32]|uniref:molybdenum cofactor guanylyltransferase n=1 Tax=Dyadobacter sp. 32 TaxID=538966 RepID=UPI0011EE0A87